MPLSLLVLGVDYREYLLDLRVIELALSSCGIARKLLVARKSDLDRLLEGVDLVVLHGRRHFLLNDRLRRTNALL